MKAEFGIDEIHKAVAMYLRAKYYPGKSFEIEIKEIEGKAYDIPPSFRVFVEAKPIADKVPE